MGWNTTELTQNRINNLARFDQARAEINNSTDLFNQNKDLLSQTKVIVRGFLEDSRSSFGERNDVFIALQNVMDIIAECEAPIPELSRILTDIDSRFERLRSQYDLPRNDRQICVSGKSLSKLAKNLAADSAYCGSQFAQNMVAGLAIASAATMAVGVGLCVSDNR